MPPRPPKPKENPGITLLLNIVLKSSIQRLLNTQTAARKHLDESGQVLSIGDTGATVSISGLKRLFRVLVPLLVPVTIVMGKGTAAATHLGIIDWNWYSPLRRCYFTVCEFGLWCKDFKDLSIISISSWEKLDIVYFTSRSTRYAMSPYNRTDRFIPTELEEQDHHRHNILLFTRADSGLSTITMIPNKLLETDIPRIDFVTGKPYVFDSRRVTMLHAHIINSARAKLARQAHPATPQTLHMLFDNATLALSKASFTDTPSFPITYGEAYHGQGVIAMMEKQLGLRCLWGHDNSSVASKIWCSKHPQATHFDSCDDPGIIEFYSDKTDINLLTPPCQTYSLGGNGLGSQEERGRHFIECLIPYLILRQLMRQISIATIMEIVSATVNYDEFYVVLRQLHDANIVPFVSILSGMEVGASSQRERLFIVGIRGESVESFPNAYARMADQLSSVSYVKSRAVINFMDHPLDRPRHMVRELHEFSPLNYRYSTWHVGPRKVAYHRSRKLEADAFSAYYPANVVRGRFSLWYLVSVKDWCIVHDVSFHGVDRTVVVQMKPVENSRSMDNIFKPADANQTAQSQLTVGNSIPFRMLFRILAPVVQFVNIVKSGVDDKPLPSKSVTFTSKPPSGIFFPSKSIIKPASPSFATYSDHCLGCAARDVCRSCHSCCGLFCRECLPDESVSCGNCQWEISMYERSGKATADFYLNGAARQLEHATDQDRRRRQGTLRDVMAEKYVFNMYPVDLEYDVSFLLLDEEFNKALEDAYVLAKWQRQAAAPKPHAKTTTFPTPSTSGTRKSPSTSRSSSTRRTSTRTASSRTTSSSNPFLDPSTTASTTGASPSSSGTSTPRATRSSAASASRIKPIFIQEPNEISDGPEVVDNIPIIKPDTEENAYIPYNLDYRYIKRTRAYGWPPMLAPSSPAFERKVYLLNSLHRICHWSRSMIELAIREDVVFFDKIKLEPGDSRYMSECAICIQAKAAALPMRSRSATAGALRATPLPGQLMTMDTQDFGGARASNVRAKFGNHRFTINFMDLVSEVLLSDYVSNLEHRSVINAIRFAAWFEYMTTRRRVAIIFTDLAPGFYETGALADFLRHEGIELRPIAKGMHHEASKIERKNDRLLRATRINLMTMIGHTILGELVTKVNCKKYWNLAHMRAVFDSRHLFSLEHLHTYQQNRTPSQIHFGTDTPVNISALKPFMQRAYWYPQPPKHRHKLDNPWMPCNFLFPQTFSPIQYRMLNVRGGIVILNHKSKIRTTNQLRYPDGTQWQSRYSSVTAEQADDKGASFEDLLAEPMNPHVPNRPSQTTHANPTHTSTNPVHPPSTHARAPRAATPPSPSATEDSESDDEDLQPPEDAPDHTTFDIDDDHLNWDNLLRLSQPYGITVTAKNKTGFSAPRFDAYKTARDVKEFKELHKRFRKEDPTWRAEIRNDVITGYLRFSDPKIQRKINLKYPRARAVHGPAVEAELRAAAHSSRSTTRVGESQPSRVFSDTRAGDTSGSRARRSSDVESPSSQSPFRRPSRPSPSPGFTARPPPSPRSPPTASAATASPIRSPTRSTSPAPHTSSSATLPSTPTTRPPQAVPSTSRSSVAPTSAPSTQSTPFAPTPSEASPSSSMSTSSNISTPRSPPIEIRRRLRLRAPQPTVPLAAVTRSARRRDRSATLEDISEQEPAAELRPDPSPSVSQTELPATTRAPSATSATAASRPPVMPSRSTTPGVEQPPDGVRRSRGVAGLGTNWQRRCGKMGTASRPIQTWVVQELLQKLLRSLLYGTRRTFDDQLL